MYSLVLLVCVLSQGQCMTIAPELIFPTRDACSVAFEMALGMAEDDVNVEVMDGKCVNWGVRS